MAENEYTIPEPTGVYTLPEPTSDTYATISSHPGNTAQRGEPSESKKNGYKAATVCLGLLCLLLSVGIIGLVIHNSELIKEKNNLVNDRDQIQSRYNNLTEERDDLMRKLCETHGFTFDGGVCYYVSTEEKTWNASRQYCRDRQSDMMVINSSEKQDLIERVTGRDQLMWTGLTDKDEEGVWKWVDRTLLSTPTYWGPGQPDDKNQKEDCDCAVFLNGNVLKGWFDIECSQRTRWICERVLW